MRSKKITELLGNITSEKKDEYDTQFAELVKHNEWMELNNLAYDTDTSPSLLIMSEHGFHPIGITKMMCEETFIFKTDEEATRAYELLEVEKNLLSGWWYSMDNWATAFEEHCNDMYDGDRSMGAKVYWLK